MKGAINRLGHCLVTKSTCVCYNIFLINLAVLAVSSMKNGHMELSKATYNNTLSYINICMVYVCNLNKI